MNRSKAMRRLFTCTTAAAVVAVCVLLSTGLVPAATNLGQCIGDAASFGLIHPGGSALFDDVLKDPRTGPRALELQV